jgi:hypothetical protein
MQTTKLSHMDVRQIIGGVSNFDDGVDRLVRDGGISKGRAILLMRRFSPSSYNTWMRQRWNSDNGRLTHQTL